MTLICTKFDADLNNISKVTSRKTKCIFWPIRYDQHLDILNIITYIPVKWFRSWLFYVSMYQESKHLIIPVQSLVKVSILYYTAGISAAQSRQANQKC